MTSRILEESEQPAWDEWLRGVDGANLRQTSPYRSGLALYGHRSEILVLEDSSGFVAGALLGIKSPLSLGAPLVHASGGLALTEPSSPAQLRALLDALLDRCSELKASSVELYSRIVHTFGDEPNPAAPALEAVLRDCKFEPSGSSETYQIDLSKDSDEALLESFTKNKRRDIRKALREGLEVERVLDPAEFAAFGETHRLMCLRKGLDAFAPGFSEQVLRPMALAGHCDLFVARFRGTVRNFLLVGTTNMPTYTWGSLAEAAREPGCPPTGEALQFFAMCRYRAMGKPAYDLGGTPGPVPESSHPNYHVWKFKYEFGGRHVKLMGSWKRSLRPAAVALIDLGRSALDLRRRLSRKQ